MPNDTINNINFDTSQSIQTHLGILQGVIERMASNSSAAKSWCITIVSAILVVIADKDKPQYVLLALIPTILFLVMDVYYLALEKGFRNAYNDFVKKIHSKKMNIEDLYSVKSKGKMLKLSWESLKSFSVWGFYLGLIVLILLAKIFVLK